MLLFRSKLSGIMFGGSDFSVKLCWVVNNEGWPYLRSYLFSVHLSYDMTDNQTWEKFPHSSAQSDDSCQNSHLVLPIEPDVDEVTLSIKAFDCIGRRQEFLHLHCYEGIVELMRRILRSRRFSSPARISGYFQSRRNHSHQFVRQIQYITSNHLAEN